MFYEFSHVVKMEYSIFLMLNFYQHYNTCFKKNEEILRNQNYNFEFLSEKM